MNPSPRPGPQHRRQPPRTCRVVAVAGVALLAGSLSPAMSPVLPSADARPGAAPSGPASPARAETSRLTATGSAFGTTVRTGAPVALSSPTAAINLCTQQVKNGNRNNVAATDLSALGQVGVATTSTSAQRVDGQRAATTTSRIAGIDLLDGALRIGAIESTSRVVKTARGFVPTGRTTIADLRIAGVKVPLDVLDQPRRIAIPGVATLWFNQLRTSRTAEGGRVSTSALRLRLVDGTTAVIARSKAALTKTRKGTFGGGAWGSTVDIGGVISSGKTANQTLPCGGTDGEILTDATANVSIPSVATIGAVESRVQSTRAASTRTGVTGAHVAEVSLGGGALVIKGITAVASVRRVDGVGGEERLVRSTEGTQVASITFNGNEVPILGDPQTIELPGLGSVTFNDREDTTRGVKVSAVTVELLGSDPDALVTVRLGNAEVRAT